MRHFCANDERWRYPNIAFKIQCCYHIFVRWGVDEISHAECFEVNFTSLH